MADVLGLTVKHMKTRRLRSYLTILGVVIGITAIVALISLGDGLENAVEQAFSALGTDVVIVFPAGLQGAPAGANGFARMDIDYLSKRVSNYRYDYNLLFEFAEIEFKNEKVFTGINSFEMDEPLKIRIEDSGLEIDKGRLIDNDESGVVMLGSRFGDDFYDDPVRVGNKITIRNKDFRVVGILEKSSGPMDDRVIMPSDDLDDLFERDGFVNAIGFVANEGTDINELKVRVENALLVKFEEDEFDANTPEDLLEQVNQILGFVNGFLVAIASISIIVGAVGIMNSMYTSVLERTKEIGIMKAIGARNSQIALIFTIESGFLGFLGGLLGTILGLGLAFLVEISAAAAGFDLISIAVKPSLIVEVLIGSTALGILFGLLPALRASKQQPVDALRYE